MMNEFLMKRRKAEGKPWRYETAGYKEIIYSQTTEGVTSECWKNKNVEV